MRFAKWQALGNDYVIVEQPDLPFALTPARVRALCAPHSGVAADGVLLLSEPADGHALARLRVFNPDGSEAEVSGNGAREAVLYLRRRGWTVEDAFAIETAAGVLRARITSPTACTLELGRARLQSEDFPSGDDGGRGTVAAGGRTWSFQHVQVGNPQCAIRVPDDAALAVLPLAEIGPDIECSELFPNRTNVSWFAPLAPDRIRARIFERGVGETFASGTGATGAAVAHVLEGGSSPVTVVLDGGELQITVGAQLEISLSGWAVPVFAGELADELVEELRAID